MSAKALRNKVLVEDSIYWQAIDVTTLEEYHTMNSPFEVRHQISSTKIEQQMWMLFFAEFFDTEHQTMNERNKTNA